MVLVAFNVFSNAPGASVLVPVCGFPLPLDAPHRGEATPATYAEKLYNALKGQSAHSLQS